MRADVARRLHTLAEEIAAAEAEAAILRDRLVAQRALLEERELAALVSETPQADRALHLAGEGHRRVQAELRRVDADLTALRFEERRLSPAGPGAR
jgi:hypothetical protein